MGHCGLHFGSMDLKRVMLNEAYEPVHLINFHARALSGVMANNLSNMFVGSYFAFNFCSSG